MDILAGLLLDQWCRILGFQVPVLVCVFFCKSLSGFILSDACLGGI